MKRSRLPASHVAGFTLVETLIATALMAAILAALVTVTAQWLPNWDRGLASVQRNETVALAVERIVADLSAAQYVTAGREFSQPVFDGSALSVTFVRTNLAPNAFPGLEVVRIAETADQRGRLVVRTRTPFMPVVKGVNDGIQPQFGDPVVLVRDPYRVSFAYSGGDRVWSDNWRNVDLLPRAIRVTLRDAATQRILSVSTATAVHAEWPAKCVTQDKNENCTGPPPPQSAPGDGGARAGVNGPAPVAR